MFYKILMKIFVIYIFCTVEKKKIKHEMIFLLCFHMKSILLSHPTQSNNLVCSHAFPNHVKYGTFCYKI